MGGKPFLGIFDILGIMNIAHQEKDGYVLNIERGEEFLSSLRAFLEKEKINAGYFTGLGAAGELELAYYNLSTKKFERHTIKEDVEILSLVGNVAMLKDETIIHTTARSAKKISQYLAATSSHFIYQVRVKFISLNFLEK